MISLNGQEENKLSASFLSAVIVRHRLLLAASGKKPYWGQTIMRNVIRPAAVKIGIAQHIGWRTFRHTYSSLLAATKADIKVMQELLRHASSRVTLDTYTQAVTIHKRRAQSRVIRLFRAPAVAAA